MRIKIWYCKIGAVDEDLLVRGADDPMRKAVEEAYAKVVGKENDFCFSGWGAKLNTYEQAVVDGVDVPDIFTVKVYQSHQSSLWYWKIEDAYGGTVVQSHSGWIEEADCRTNLDHVRMAFAVEEDGETKT